MLINDILGLNASENIYFVEDSYAALKHNSISLDYLENLKDDPEAYFESIMDEKGNTSGIVLLNPENEESPEFRAIFTDIVSSNLAPNESSKRFSDISGKLKINKTYNTTNKKFSEAVFEYFSNALVNREFCDNCLSTKEPYEMVYIKSRNDRLITLLDKIKLKGDILEICCGNGMSTLPMHEMGYDPLATDIDRCQICQGLEHNVLYPARTVILDATRLSDFFPRNRFDTVTGFMLGTIYPFNKGIWEKMIFEAVYVLKPGGMILLTVNKKEEMNILQHALDKAGLNGEIIDNTDEKGIYDQWVYAGIK